MMMTFNEAIELVKKDNTELKNLLKNVKTQKDIENICNSFYATTIEQKNELLMRGLGIWKTTDDSEEDRFESLCDVIINRNEVPLIF